MHRFSVFFKLKAFFSVLNLREKVLIIIAISLFIIGIFWLLIYFYNTYSIIVPAKGGTYIEGLICQPYMINPLYYKSNSCDDYISNLVYSSLFKIQNKKLIPFLVKSYKINGNKEYILELKKNVKWHDGKELTSDDVVFTFQLIKDPIIKSTLYNSFKDVEVEKLDKYKLKLTLNQEYSLFLYTLTFGILPKHIWSTIEPQNIRIASYNLKAVGSGPYIITSFKRDSKGQIYEYNFKSNKDYFLNEPYIEKVILKFYPDINSAIEALNSEKIIALGDIDSSLESKIISKKVRFMKFLLPQYTALFFNLQNKKFANKEFRKAILLSINKHKVLKDLIDGGEIIDSPITKYFLNDNNKDKEVSNKKLALKLFNKLGYKKIKKQDFLKKIKSEDTKRFIKALEMQEFLVKNGQILRIKILTGNNEQYKKIANNIKTELMNFGILVELKILDIDDVLQLIKKREYETLLFSEILDYSIDLYPFWHSSQINYPGLNFSGFLNKDLDRTLEKLRKVNDEKEIKKLYKKIDEIFKQEVPCVFLYSPAYTFVISQDVKGIDISSLVSSTDRIFSISNWYFKTKKKIKI